MFISVGDYHIFKNVVSSSSFQECCVLILENSSHPKYANSVADKLFIPFQNARIIPTEKKADILGYLGTLGDV